jgi:hypothetical protein
LTAALLASAAAVETAAAATSCAGAPCLPPSWDFAWADGHGSWTTPYVLELARRLNAEMFPDGTTWNGKVAYTGPHGGYLDRNYRNYATTVPGGWYMRHAGMDFWRAADTLVRSLTDGVVTAILAVEGDTTKHPSERYAATYLQH